jgi:hypothetical protein
MNGESIELERQLPAPPERVWAALVDVTFSLTPADGATRLRVRPTGFGPGDDWARARAWHERAWATILDNLEAHLAGRPLPRPWNE